MLPKLPAKEFTKLINLDPWEINPVTIEEFILSQKYLDLGATIFPKIFDILCTIFGNNPRDLYQYQDVNFLGGIGCFSGNTKIIDTSGKIRYMRDLVDQNLEVFALHKNGRDIVKAQAIGKYSGVKKVIRIVTESGREYICTPTHEFYSDLGWRKAKDLLNRGVMVSSKLKFNETIQHNIPYEEQERIKRYINFNRSKVKNVLLREDTPQEILNLPMYSSEFLGKFLKDLRTGYHGEFSESDIYTNVPNSIRGCGLRTGELFSKIDNSLVKFNYAGFANDIAYDKVIKIEDLDREVDVYDLEVEEHENFILYDGTVVHNSGKTLLGAIAQTYIFYKLRCLRNCRGYLGAADDKPMALVNCAPSAAKAQKLVFSAIREYVSTKECFKGQNIVCMSKEIKAYKDKAYELNIYSGSSTPNSVIGLNIFSAVIDETCFFERSSEKDDFENLYKGIKDRISSRFGDRGLVISLSSPMTVDDYAWQMLKKVRQEGREILLEQKNSIRKIQDQA